MRLNVSGNILDTYRRTLLDALLWSFFVALQYDGKTWKLLTAKSQKITFRLACLFCVRGCIYEMETEIFANAYTALFERMEFLCVQF